MRRLVGGALVGLGLGRPFGAQLRDALEVPGVVVAAPSLRGAGQVVAGNSNWSTQYFGTTNDYLVARDWPLAAGRGFEPAEMSGSGKVALIGQTTAHQLFGDADPIDQTIRVRKVPLAVVGVLARKGQNAFGQDQDDVVLLPISTARNRVLDRLDRERVPYVLVFNQLARAERPTVSVDNRAAAREIVEHLIGLGHRAIRMLTGQFRQSDRARLRYRGYCDALQAAGLEPLPPLQMPFLAPDARLPLVEGLAARARPTAFFCSNDYLALTVIRNLTALGRRVPDDVSVAGFDGIRIGELTAPSLTTVVQPSERIGGAAVELLLRRVVDTGEVASVALQHTLRRGGSTAAVAANPRAGRALAVLS
jgi:hypothetical protein